MSGPLDAFAILSIIANVAALIDYSGKILSRIDDFSGKVKVMPKAFRNLNIILPPLGITLEKTRCQIDANRVDGRTCKALLPLVIDCKAQMEELKVIFEKTLPKEKDKWFQILWKAMYSVWKGKKVEAISVAIDRYVAVLTMTFAEAGDTTLRDLLSISTSISRGIHRAPDIPWNQKPIYLTDAVGTTHLVPFEFYHTVKVRSWQISRVAYATNLASLSYRA